MGMEPVWRLRIMARVGDAIRENGGLVLKLPDEAYDGG